MGRASTNASHQSALSKGLNPPVKWSYRKLIFWSVLVFLCGGWLVFYVNIVATNATTVVSGPLALFGFIAAVTFVGALFVTWRHNQSTHPRAYAEWDRSFICQKCGAVSQQ
jgi:hypothetical protein